MCSSSSSARARQRAAQTTCSCSSLCSPREIDVQLELEELEHIDVWVELEQLEQTTRRSSSSSPRASNSSCRSASVRTRESSLLGSGCWKQRWKRRTLCVGLTAAGRGRQKPEGRAIPLGRYGDPGGQSNAGTHPMPQCECALSGCWHGYLWFRIVWRGLA